MVLRFLVFVFFKFIRVILLPIFFFIQKQCHGKDLVTFPGVISSKFERESYNRPSGHPQAITLHN